jgi:hypothetical protein
MAFLRYTANNGTVYAVKTRARYVGALDKTAAGTAQLGFSAFVAGDPPLPKGMRMRTVHVQDPSGGAVRSIPVGLVTAPAWATPTTVQIDYSGIGTLTDGIVIGRTEEHPAQLPHTIVNVSDAS